MVSPHFSEYSYIREVGSNPELVYYGFVILFLFLREKLIV